jgi:hypothetical protein
MQVGAPAAGLGASAASFRLGNPTRRPTCRPIFHQESPRTTRPTKSTQQHAGEFGGAERLDPYGRLSLPARAGGGISQPSWCSSSLSHISTLALPYAVYRSVVQRRGRGGYPPGFSLAPRSQASLAQLQNPPLSSPLPGSVSPSLAHVPARSSAGGPSKRPGASHPRVLAARACSSFASHWPRSKTHQVARQRHLGPGGDARR